MNAGGKPAARVVVPEILDGLPHDDPRAVASRRDLRRINLLMGNPGWFARVARRHQAAAARGLVEIGAGDGVLARRLARAFPETPVTALDLAPAPAGPLPQNLQWLRRDLFEPGWPADAEAARPSGMLAACLFLHHFEGDRLAWIGRALCTKFEVCAFVEPDRRALAHRLGRLAWPFINDVTRHDMHVSIDAGFAAGELAELLGLDASGWRVSESTTLTGARRFLAVRL